MYVTRMSEISRGLPVYIVDAFTSQPFTGNPAAVCLLNEPREDGWMQAVAREMNLSETAFLVPCETGYRLRWFTPAVEVDLCGHATLASAHILWETGKLPISEVARFETRSGILTAHADGTWITLDFPAEPVSAVTAPRELADGLGVACHFVGLNRMDYLVEVADEQTVRSMHPDLSLLASLPVRGVIVTSATTSSYDFVSRFFAPRVGVAEDPVCGSAHCALTPYWSARLQKEYLVGYQASARGGIVRVHQVADRVQMSGEAVTVLKGVLESV